MDHPKPSIALTFTLICVLGTLVVIMGQTAPFAQAQGAPALAFEAVNLPGNSDLIVTRASSIDLAAFPIVPTSAGRGRAIALKGLALGRDPHSLSKVGDCNSAEWLFLHTFGAGQYNLGAFTELQGVIDHYAAAFTYQTYAAHNGMNVHAVLDPIWANTADCLPGESPLQCEYRQHNPGVAVIMFGTNDMFSLTVEQFDHSLRRVVVETMQAGIVPLLSTFPRHLGHPDRSVLWNQIVVRVALDYNIPLMNLWLALEPLPNYGIDKDEFHLNGPLTASGDLSSSLNLTTGYPMRNLVTLQALDVVWRDTIKN